MWIYNDDLNKWIKSNDSLSIDSFDLLKQELSSYRLYSKCLSGASYIPITGTDDIYDVLSDNNTTWYISVTGSQYSNTLIPLNSTPINKDTAYDYYTRNNREYSSTLKNLFTPNRLINDSLKNYLYVDVATNEELFDIFNQVPNRVIDGIRLKEGHRVLIKDQKTTVVLSNLIDPNTFFRGNFTVKQQLGTTIEYEFYNSDNGIYLYQNNNLIKQNDLDDYDNSVRYSVCVKLGSINSEKQYHLSRLSNGYYPVSSLDEPIEFIEAKNWILRHQVDYNNLFEINYYDVVKYDQQSYYMDGITYSIPERILSIGEFGVILNTQFGISNIIDNKYKVNLRSIDQTLTHYWIVGDGGILLKIRKHDFELEKIELGIESNLKSISFYDDLNGVVVGEFNTISVTRDGGYNWVKLRIKNFDGFNFNSVKFGNVSRFYVVGNSGVFIEFNRNFDNWNASRRRISKFIDEEDEYLLVDNINDLLITNIDWSLNFSYSTQSTNLNKDILLLVTDDSKIIAHDINDSIPGFDFVYLETPLDYGDIVNIIRSGTSSNFYFTGSDGLYEFDINDFQNINIGNSNSNSIYSSVTASLVSNLYSNQIFDYQSSELYLAGNESLLVSSTYSNVFDFNVLDENFESRLKSKLLFLDYDIASKLNWFTDSGDYRLPNEVSFMYVTASNGDYISFHPIEIPATQSSATQSETNWIEYWKDRSLTFEYYSTSPMSDPVIISSTFSYNQQSTSNTVSVSVLSSDIINLAPTILTDGHSRYNSTSVAISAPINIFDLYLYDYLAVYRVDINYPVQLGDVMRIESDIVNNNSVVNKIITLSGYKYIYMFTEFNGNILKGLSQVQVTVINLNKYSTQLELENRFNLHDLSNGYEMKYSTQSSVLEIKPKFNNMTSYYNLATQLITQDSSYTMVYTSGFLKFGYKPTYNILDYLQSINNQTFTTIKTYYSMPDYRGIPIGNLSSDVVFVELINPSDVNAQNLYDIRLNFGSNLKLEWESIFINTFVDIRINNLISTDTTEKMLVFNKYKVNDVNGERYVIEFIRKFNFTNIGNPVSQNLSSLQSLGDGSIDIISRRELIQISEDLQYLNNIHRSRASVSDQIGTTQSGQIWTSAYNKYERDLNFKINTDSYAKILLSDSDTKNSLTGIIYTDYKNELSFNVIKLAEKFEIPILSTQEFEGDLFITCSEKHGLDDQDGVVLEFNGGTGSSSELNNSYFGYNPVTVVNEFSFFIRGLSYGVPVLVGNDSGFVKYIKRDPFFNYTPIDLIELGSDRISKISIELNQENTRLEKDEFNLVNIDYNKFRFRLVDGLNIETLAISYPWIYEAEISDAVIGQDINGLVWYKGTWECGRWFGGTWQSGTWKSGDWYGGIWNSKLIKDNWINVEVDDKSSNEENSKWFGGRWYEGTWNNGTWYNGRWYGGSWNDGRWFKGIWNDGTWNKGTWSGGVWVLGKWNGGIFNTDSEPSYWIDGNWNGGDFENGIWYNGFFSESSDESRFGVKSYNSRTATWHSGKFISGSLHSRLNVDRMVNISYLMFINIPFGELVSG
jgi:hypothetical protein